MCGIYFDPVLKNIHIEGHCSEGRDELW